MNTETVLKILSMLQTCAFWAAAFVVVYFITNALGLRKDVPSQTKKELKEVNDAVDYFIKKMSDSKQDSQENLMDYLKKLIKAQKRASKLFAMFDYDNPSSAKVQEAYQQIDRVTGMCKQISVFIGKNEQDKIIPVLQAIKMNIEKSEQMLDAIIKDEDEKRFLNI